MNIADLSHHGTLGQKWGLRRYQNEDGTLTPAGKERYRKGISTIKVKKVKNKVVKENKENEGNSKQKNENLTNDELSERIKRLQLEKQYNELVKSLNPTKESAGKQFVMGVLKKSAENISGQLVTYAMGSIVNTLAGENIVNPKKGQKDK